MNDRQNFNNEIHKLGRLFSAISIAVIALAPVVFCLITKTSPDWKAILKAFAFILGYWAIGLVEAVKLRAAARKRRTISSVHYGKYR